MPGRTALEKALLGAEQLSYLLLNKQNKILDCSLSVLNFLQISKEEITNQHVFDIFPSLILEHNSILSYQTQSKEIFEFKVTFFKESDSSIYLVLNDISSLSSSLTDVHQATTLFKVIKETTPDIVILKDSSGKWLDWNARAESLLPECSDMDKLLYLSSDCTLSDKEAWKSGSFVRVDEQLPDGNIYDVVKIPIYNSDNSPKYLLVTARNITERASREAGINKLNAFISILRDVDKIVLQEDSVNKVLNKSIHVLANSDLFISSSVTSSLEDNTQFFEAGIHLNWAEIIDHPKNDNITLEFLSSGCLAVTLHHKTMLYGYIYAKPCDTSDLFSQAELGELLSEVAGSISRAINLIKLSEKQKLSEGMLNAFFDNLPGIAFIRDSNSRYVKMNQFFIDSFAESDWIKKDPIELFGQAEGKALVNRDQRVIREKTFNHERPFPDKFGVPRVFDAYYFTIDGSNDLPFIGGVGIETTDKINVHNALLKSEERYRTIFESAISAVAVLSPEGVIEEANINVVELTGYTREEILGKMSWTSFVYPEDLQMVAEQRKKRLATSSGNHQEYEFRLIRKDKSIRHIRMRTGTIPGSDGVGVISLSDVTSTVNYQKQLKQALTKTEAILESIPDIMFVLSRDGKYLDFHGSNRNDSLLKSYAIEDNAFIGIKFPVENREELLAIIDLTLTTLTVNNFDYSLQLPDGKHFYEACLSPFESDSALVLSRDVTRRKKSEEEQLHLQAQLRHSQKLESLGVLAGGIAHDFNNILMAISGNTQLAQAKYENGGKITKYLKAIDLATARASDLATQMLDYSGRTDSRMLPLNINIIIKEMSDILGITVTRKAKLNLNLDTGVPLILGDDSQIRQVFMNLITNASEAFENKHGKISVKTGIKYLQKEYIDSFSSLNKLTAGHYIFMEVADNGSGISDKIKDKIFDPFFTTKFTGRGLGLSAVLGIMSNHSGALQLESMLGEGTVFRAYFPVTCDNASSIPDVQELNTDDMSMSGSVLCVDDEPLVREVLGTMLEQLGFSVIMAVDGIDCIRKFIQNSDTIDLILLDVTMPNMNGDEAFYEIRKLREDIPVIISSGYAEAEIVTRFPSKYPDGFLQKPYSANELKRIVKSLLNL